MSAPAFFTTLILILGAVVLIFGMRCFSATRTAHARIAAETSLKAIAEQALASQTRTEAALSAIRTELSALSTSLSAVENILKQVG